MKDLKTIISAAVVAVGLLAGGLAIGSGIRALTYGQRTVNVRGLAERTVKANQVIWPIQFAITGNDLSQVYNECTQKNKIVTAFLTDNGIPASEISVNPPDVTDMTANEWQTQPALFKYKIVSNITVTSVHVDQVRTLLNRQGELLSQGIAFSNPNLTYNYTELNKIKPEMINEATRNARDAAQKFAENSDSKLGKIKDAEQGYFSIDNNDDTTPYIKKIRVVTNVTYYLKD